jgi:hypothetical protein
MSAEQRHWKTWRPNLARRVRDALSGLRNLARDVVRFGPDCLPSQEAMLQDAIAGPLEQFGLDRVAADLRALLPVPTTEGTPPSDRLGPLLRILIACGMAQCYPDPPSKREQMEKMLRSKLDPHEQLVLRGQVLNPLHTGLVWNVGLRRIFSIQTIWEDYSKVGLARTVALGIGSPAPVKTGFVVPGVTVGPGVDRRMLRCAEGSLMRVSSQLAADLGDPFCDRPAEQLIGPLTVNLHASGLNGKVALMDGDGNLARMQIGRREIPLNRPVRLHVLARPYASVGQLYLTPSVLWIDGVRRPFSQGEETPEPWKDPLLEDVEGALTDSLRCGLESAASVRHRPNRFARKLLVAGYVELARLVAPALALPAAEAAFPFLFALHLVRVYRYTARFVAKAA